MAAEAAGQQKAPDLAIWNQTRGTPHAGKAFSRAGGRAANAKYRFGGLEGSSWAAKMGHAGCRGQKKPLIWRTEPDQGAAPSASSVGALAGRVSSRTR